MSVALLDRPPPLHRNLGPYRTANHAALPDESRCELSYAEAGVAEYGIVDPAGRHIAFLVSDGTAFTVHPPESGPWRSPVVQAVEVDGFWAAVERKFGPLADTSTHDSDPGALDRPRRSPRRSPPA